MLHVDSKSFFSHLLISTQSCHATSEHHPRPNANLQMSRVGPNPSGAIHDLSPHHAYLGIKVAQID
jgi:hypothetical protein